VAEQHVHHLRQLIDAGLAHERPEPGDPIVTGSGNLGAGHAGPHGAELVERERDTALAHPSLAVDRGAARAQPGRCREDQEDRPYQAQDRDRDPDVQEPSGQARADSLIGRHDRFRGRYPVSSFPDSRAHGAEEPGSPCSVMNAFIHQNPSISGESIASLGTRTRLRVTRGSQRALRHVPVARSNSRLWPRQRITPSVTTLPISRSSPACGQYRLISYRPAGASTTIVSLVARPRS